MRKWLVLLLLSLFAPLLLACSDGQSFAVMPKAKQRVDPAHPTRPSNAVSGVSVSSGQSPALASTDDDRAEWLVMLYFDADDNTLERDSMIDLNEAERAGSSDQVHIVAQVDRYAGAFAGMGDWTTTKRFYLTPDDDLNSIGSTELADLGELNMADGDTLVDFITWAVTRYPARKHMLILSDHGSGWPGGYSDNAPGGRGKHDLVLADYMQDNLWLMELDAALGTALSQTGLEKFELIGFDACLMGQLEVYSALVPHARYAVASEEVEPGLGWAYTSFLEQLIANPKMNGATLAQVIVDSYINQDQRLLDDEARRQFLAEYNADENTSPSLIAGELFYNATLSGLDLSAVPALGHALDHLSLQLLDIDPKTVDKARTYAQSFETAFDTDLPSPYIDLGHFALWLRDRSGHPDVVAAADQLLSALDQAVIAERHGDGRPGATGVAFYFPTRELYEFGDNLEYTTIADRFTRDYKWDEFLHTHFTDERRESWSGAAKPIQIAPLTLSAEIAAPNQPVNMQTEINGDRLGFIYSFIGRVLPEQEMLIVEDVDYLFSDETQEIGGVPYPVWSSEGVIIDFDWDPIVYAINDGDASVRALLEPDTYGDIPTYATEGTYVFADGSESTYARLFFRKGKLSQVYGYAGRGNQGALHEITPQPGDQFIVWEQGLDLRGDTTQDKFQRDGGILTFGAEPFWIEAIPAPSGSYIVGFMAENLDGETFAEFEMLFVENTASSAVEGFVPYANQELGFALLYPETWSLEEDADGANVTFVGDYGVTLALVARESYPDAPSADTANRKVIQEMITVLNAYGDLENLQFVTEVDPFLLGGFEAKTIDFAFTLEDQAFYGSVIASTPVPDTTYAFLILALSKDYDMALDDFNPMLHSFDILISGVDKEQAGLPPPGWDNTDPTLYVGPMVSSSTTWTPVR